MDVAPCRYGMMLALAADVASGLLHLHQHGVVHGDVKVRGSACVTS